MPLRAVKVARGTVCQRPRTESLQNVVSPGRSSRSSGGTRSLQSVDSERVQNNYTLSDQQMTFSSYSSEWAEKVICQAIHSLQSLTKQHSANSSVRGS